MPSLTAVEPAAKPILGKPLPLRVAFAGARARALLGAAVHAVDLDRTRVDELDAVVVESGAEAPAGLEQARKRGLPVIAVGGEGGATAAFADVRLGPGSFPDPPVLGAPPVDVRSFNPLPFRRDGVGGYRAVAGSGAHDDAAEAALPLLDGAAELEPVALSVPEGAKLPPLSPEIVPIDPPGTRPLEWLEALHARLGVLDHPAFHASQWERAGWIAKLCVSGLPVVCEEMGGELRTLLGAGLAELLEPVSVRDLADLDERERISVAVRRVALREHSAEARWRQLAKVAGIEVPARPMVSVVFATRREGWLQHGLAQINRQTYEPRELVVCLHGDEFADGIEERVRALTEGPLKIVHVDAELTLGDALNAGVEVAEGEVVTKMDDDDYYNTDHLWDLVLALDYSGAELVGKAAEFVYLEEIDVTVRQISHDVETRLAGGGMMMRRAALVEQGGWPQRTRAEDLALIRMYEGNDRPIHRIPPHGYILNRHGRDHTWRPAVDYFLFRSEEQWRGLRFDATGID